MDDLLRQVEEQAKMIDELTQRVKKFEAYFNNRLDQLELRIEAIIPRREDIGKMTIKEFFVFCKNNKIDPIDLL